MIPANKGLQDALAAGDADAVAAGLERLVREEDAAVLANTMKPYEDQVPAVVTSPYPQVIAAALDRLPTALAKRALFGSYARIPDGVLRDLLAMMTPTMAARLVEAMSVGIDGPREMARILARAGAPHEPLLGHVHPEALLRLLEQMDDAGIASLGRLGAPRGALDGVVDLLRERGDDLRRTWLEDLQAGGAPEVPDLNLLRTGGVPEAADALTRVPYGRLREVFDEIGYPRAGELLAHLAIDRPHRAAALMVGVDRRLLLRPPTAGRRPHQWLQESRAAAVLAALDLRAPHAARLLDVLPPDHLEMLLPHLPWEQRHVVEQRIGADALPLGIEVLGVGPGRRRTRRLDAGRWVRIEETLNTGAVGHRITTDLLELPLDEVRLEARRAVQDHQALPVADIASRFEEYRSTGRRPGNADFARLGMVQLSRELDRTGAVAGINGGFYFDYGHYINGVTLGIDMAAVPGLFYGDPIGWFVSSGEELAPPSFNRAAAAVTTEGELLIDRVMMDEVAIGERPIRWDDINVPKQPGKTILYNSLFGYRTEPGDSHVDVACARGKVYELSSQGAQVIPLTGFVLAVPRETADRVLGDTGVGTPVTSRSAFTQRRPDIAHAMACGPLLVRDRVIDLDFEREDFGQQDSTVMSFFLPRTVETYRAARSFMGRRGSTLVLGTVSGTAYGFGRSDASAGVTFGELAQMCVDLGLDTAYALDGGGSSSVVARDGGRLRVLNAPTGGADVAAGEERFINTYWLIHPKEKT